MNRRAFLSTAALLIPPVALAGKLGPPAEEPPTTPPPTPDLCTPQNLALLTQEQLLAGQRCAEAVVEAYKAEVARRTLGG